MILHLLQLRKTEHDAAKLTENANYQHIPAKPAHIRAETEPQSSQQS
jgi:hypothetical protein